MTAISLDWELQAAIRGRLVASAEIVALVPAGNILDRHKRPAPMPAIILGQSEEVPGPGIDRARREIVHTVHVFVQEPSFEVCKRIAAAAKIALENGARFDLGAGLHCASVEMLSARYLRDPTGADISHGVLVFSMEAQEGAAA